MSVCPLELFKSNRYSANCAERDNACTPEKVLQSKALFRQSSCCDHSQLGHLFRNNCCCTAYYYVATDDTVRIRKATLITLIFFYCVAVLVLCRNFYDSYRVSVKRAKSTADFLKSRKFLFFLVSVFSMIIGICSAVYHAMTFDCFGGRDPASESTDSDVCPGGTSARSICLFYIFFTTDAIANVSFIVSKIMILQNCLRTAQLGHISSAANEGPSVRILFAAVFVLCASCISWLVVAFVNQSSGDDFVSVLKQNELRNGIFKISFVQVEYRHQLRSAIYSSGACSFVIATLTAFLYIRHTGFHLKLYLQPLQACSPATDDKRHTEHNAQTMKHAMSGNMGKVISGNFRRLQVAAALIACSFLIKTQLYVLLAVGVAVSTAGVGCPAIDYNVFRNFTLQNFCDENYSQSSHITARSFLGSPLVFPLISLFADPFMMMCVTLLYSIIEPQCCQYQRRA